MITGGYFDTTLVIFDSLVLFARASLDHNLSTSTSSLVGIIRHSFLLTRGNASCCKYTYALSFIFTYENPLQSPATSTCETVLHILLATCEDDLVVISTPY
jgi:hypothetical protein